MKIKNVGVAGTMESSDIMVTVEPREEDGIEIDLSSTVEKQFGDEIRELIANTFRGLEVSGAHVKVVDKGALDCVIRARVKTAIHRASGVDHYSWRS